MREPEGVPGVGAPDGVIPLASACFLPAYIEGVSAARALAEKNGYAIDPRQELLALAAANCATAFGRLSSSPSGAW